MSRGAHDSSLNATFSPSLGVVKCGAGPLRIRALDSSLVYTRFLQGHLVAKQSP